MWRSRRFVPYLRTFFLAFCGSLLVWEIVWDRLGFIGEGGGGTSLSYWAQKPSLRSSSSPESMNTACAATIKKIRTPYPRRVDMGACQKTFGEVAIFVVATSTEYRSYYRIAQQSLQCYIASTNYTFHMLNFEGDSVVNERCNHSNVFFKKHCIVAINMALLSDTVDWVLVLDADTGVVNPNHCIEEWIDDRVELLFYERFFNWEIASGNYIARNSEFSRDFIMRWSLYEFHLPEGDMGWLQSGHDNGALQYHILETVLPAAKAELKACWSMWNQSYDYGSYMAYVVCVKVTLGAARIYPGQLRIYRRAHGWVRDGWLTDDAWADTDFMLHGWKQQAIGEEKWESPFTQDFNESKCEPGSYSGWPWRPDKRRRVSEVRKILADWERKPTLPADGFPAAARVHPFLSEPDVGECYPHCDELT